MVRHHSVISTMLKCCICMGIIGVGWIFIGFSLAFGDDAGGGGFVGNPWTYLWFRNVGTAPNANYAATIPFCIYAMFQLKFAVITPALSVSGYIERIRFAPFIVYIILYMMVIYSFVAHWVWSPNGFLHVWGVKDFAGGSVVHMTSGWSALATSIVIGRREAKRRGEEIHPNTIPFVILGTGMLWFGWFGFNAGSELAADQNACNAFMNTNTATAAAMLMWNFLEGATGHKPSAVGACVGAVVGLVIITPACGYINVGQSLFFGGFGACVCYTAVWLMHKTKIDDGLDSFATHGVGGTVGCILTGAFNTQGPNYGTWQYFGYFWASIVIIAAWSFFWSFTLMYVIGLFTRLRVTPEEEDYGLDDSQHGESMYRGTPLGESIYNSQYNKSVYNKGSEEGGSEGPKVEYPIYQEDFDNAHNAHMPGADPHPTPAVAPSPGTNLYY